MQQQETGASGRHQREILLSVIGLTPQVVTETFYALAVLQKRPCPTEIHLIASEEGAHRARLELLDPRRGQLAALCRQYGLPVPRCDESTIHMIRRDKQPVGDLRSASDNEAAADTILDVVRQLTADPDARIHFSIAGGRKTMTFYLGYCASMLGRAQDEMSHVMVNSPFESMPEFFFPPAEPTVIHDRAGRPHDTRDAEIDLAPVPFVRLRGKIPPILLTERRSFGTTVRIVNALETRQLTLGLTPPKKARGAVGWKVCLVEGLELNLPPKSFALLWMFASIKANAPLDQQVHSGNWRELYEHHMIPVYRVITNEGPRAHEEAHALSEKDEAQFRNEIDKLNKALRENIGPGADESFGVDVTGNKRKRFYSLRLAPDAILFVGSELIGKLPPR